jgi:hypothetical protein
MLRTLPLYNAMCKIDFGVRCSIDKTRRLKGKFMSNFIYLDSLIASWSSSSMQELYITIAVLSNQHAEVVLQNEDFARAMPASFAKGIIKLDIINV